ncbi:alpha-N-acetylglucosaminidase [Rheinheimera pacifica]|uniref:alpha-N-acetylglucosaminidase n=1 Tax=Rheinheimera pacifica TaxID=173990 RepID=UPI002854DF3E|nr:alpha-N-acetylglucosaminidase [Rheinheimera pacifica]MDR6984630.1 alpha-N-acetylglucosaminidase [Rheinheimera pacifica]
MHLFPMNLSPLNLSQFRRKVLASCLLAGALLTGCSPVVEPPQSLVAEQQNSAAAEPVRQLFERVAGQAVPHVHFSLVNDEQPDWYQVEAHSGQLYVSGNALTALSYGTYEYLRQIGAMSVSWEGSRVQLPQQFADYPAERVTALFQQRAYLNVCAYGYTTPWWSWDRWQQELDWMALHGVNNPVAMEGQEYIWQQLWREFGVSDQELAAYFSGPAFTPWQRMGNIEGHEGPLPQAYIDKKHQLQKQILQKMASYGMKPVVPAFSGYVPEQFVKMFPDARIIEMKAWSGFPKPTYWLDPADPLFAKVAKRFIELYNAEYGEQHYYLMDAFNEMLPPVSTENRYQDLAGYGEALYQSLAQVVPNANWVMQGWMFGSDRHFWDLDSIQAFLSRIPDDKMMIHDIGNDRYDVWQGAKGFYGKQWVFGFIHNYGGSNPVYADFDFYREKTAYALNHEEKGNLTGYGVFPEGIHGTSSAYEYMFDVAWQGQATATTEWLQQYLNARYGSTSPALLSAWNKLYKAVLSTKYWDPRWWEGSAGAYLLFKRPSTEYLRSTGAPGDLALLDEALRDLVALPLAQQQDRLFRYDLVDFARHAVTQHIDMLLQHTTLAYQQGKVEQGDNFRRQAEQLILGVDALIGGQQETLYSWVNDARAYADTPELAAFYERNARKQVTIWGGSSLKDYASKAWQGMYAHFYLPRWQVFFAAQRQAALSGKPLDTAALEQRLIEWENAWLDQPLPPASTVPADVVSAVKVLQQLVTASKAPPSNL